MRQLLQNRTKINSCLKFHKNIQGDKKNGN